MKYERKNRKHNMVKTLTEAQKLAFAPLTFQAINAMIKFGMLKLLTEKDCSKSEIIETTGLSDYAVNLLLEVGQVAEIVEKTAENTFCATQLGTVFLYDEMTRVNFNFVNDVCYLGASELANSFRDGKPDGLHRFIKKSETIYPLLPELPENIKKSWFEFDNFYSDICFEEIYKIIAGNKPSQIFDIGGNTGKFERICLKNNAKITMLDLPENIDNVKDNKELCGCDFIKINVLKDEVFPKMEGAILMSQFLDCFSKDEIVSILKKLSKSIVPDTKIYILEPFIDNQKFKGAKYSLIHTSLYFTCMANGNSKMYSLEDMKKCVENSGLKLAKIHGEIGKHDYTLLECTK